MIGFLLSVGIIFALAMYLVAVYTRRVAELMLTDKFRAAESLSNQCIPEKWRRDIRRVMALHRFLPWLGELTGSELAVQKIDQLQYFFEHSPFFENEETRRLLLEELAETRRWWEKMTLEEILSESI